MKLRKAKVIPFTFRANYRGYFSVEDENLIET